MKMRSASSSYGSRLGAAAAADLDSGALMGRSLQSKSRVEPSELTLFGARGEEAQALCQRAQHRLGEARAHLDERHEGVAAHRQQRAIRLGHRSGEARRLVDQ